MRCNCSSQGKLMSLIGCPCHGLFSKRVPLAAGGFQANRHFFWVLPTWNAILYGLIALATVGLYRITNDPWFPCVVHFSMLHLINGFKKIDGLSDLGKGILYKLNHPDSPLEKVWQIIRNPATGAYGTAIIVIYFMLLVSTGALLLRQSRLDFVVFSILSGVLSTLTLVFSISSKHFNTGSDFYPLVQCIATPFRRLPAIAAAGVLITPLVFLYKGRLVMAVFFGLLIVFAMLIGMLLRSTVLRILKEMNGDILGFSLCIGELFLLMVSALGVKLLP